jgi:hypothetical protein
VKLVTVHNMTNTSLSSSSQPTLIIVTDEKTFEISPWTTEGYAVHLLTQGTKRDIENATDDLESNDPYAILGLASCHLSSLYRADLLG